MNSSQAALGRTLGLLASWDQAFAALAAETTASVGDAMGGTCDDQRVTLGA